MGEMKVGGRCGYMEPVDDGAVPCQEMGLRFTVYDNLTGTYHSIVRCVEHSDWIEVTP